MTTAPLSERLPEPRVLIEAFALANIAFLGADIVLAHAINQFAVWTQWVPVALSAACVPLLALVWLCEERPRTRALGRGVGLLIGWSFVACGIAGLVLHLNAHFFVEKTLRNLVYTAPFVAPLAYAGVGLLLILNRSRVENAHEWAEWVLVLALGGFAGNFALTLADHAQNGFFEHAEWIGVGAAALAVGFLFPLIACKTNRAYLWVCASVIGLQVLVGMLGFALHAEANLRGPADSVWENFLYGAPAFAPLLFANLALLAWIGLWALARAQRSEEHATLRRSRAQAIIANTLEEQR